MRICILTQPRTSSTNLLFLLGSLSGYKTFNEPFHKVFGVPEYWSNEFTKEDNIILKEMPFYHNPFGVSGYENFIEWTNNEFDKVFYLLRKNTQLQSESFTYHNTLSSIDLNTKWHTQKKYDMSIVHPIKIEIEKKLMDERNQIFIEESKRSGNPFFYYEDLIENSGDNATLRNLLDFLSLTFNKYKVNTFYGIHKKCRIETNTDKTLI